MNSSKEEEFALFQSEVKKLKLINPQKTKDEKSEFKAKEKFIKDFVTVWTKIMNADRANLKKLN